VDWNLFRSWTSELEENFSCGDIPIQKNFYFLGMNVNVLFKPIQGDWASLFILGGGGIGCDDAGKRVSQIGDSHCGGILQGGQAFTIIWGKD